MVFPFAFGLISMEARIKPNAKRKDLEKILGDVCDVLLWCVLFGSCFILSLQPNRSTTHTTAQQVSIIESGIVVTQYIRYLLYSVRVDIQSIVSIIVRYIVWCSGYNEMNRVSGSVNRTQHNNTIAYPLLLTLLVIHIQRVLRYSVKVYRYRIISVSVVILVTVQ